MHYSWFFDDGTPAIAVLELADDHAYLHAPGIYYVTVTASSEGNPSQSRDGDAVLYLPPTANRPAMLEQHRVRRSNGGRVWVVNQDNNSVSVFDAATNAKLAEIAVGAAPRTLAVAPNGSVWVTNKHAATISVIDPVVR